MRWSTWTRKPTWSFSWWIDDQGNVHWTPLHEYSVITYARVNPLGNHCHQYGPQCNSQWDYYQLCRPLQSLPIQTRLNTTTIPLTSIFLSRKPTIPHTFLLWCTQWPSLNLSNTYWHYSLKDPSNYIKSWASPSRA